MPISYLDDIHLHDASELQIGTVSGGQSKIYKNGAFSSWNCIDASGFEITHGASNRWITGMPGTIGNNLRGISICSRCPESIVGDDDCIRSLSKC